MTMQKYYIIPFLTIGKSEFYIFSITKLNTFFSFVLFVLHSLYHSVLIFQSTKGFGIEHNYAFQM